MLSTTSPNERFEFPALGGREEAWRFTPTRRLRGLGTAVPADGAEGKLVISVDADDPVRVEAIEPGDSRLAFDPVDRVAAVAFAGFTAGVAISVPAGTSVPRAVSVDVRADGGMAFGHLAIRVGRGSELVVVVNNHGSGTVAANIEAHLEDGAHLQLVSLQDWDSDGVHLGQHAFTVGRDATLRSVELTFGGDLVRVVSTAALVGPGSDVSLDGLYFADSEQHLEHRLRVDHASERCRSRVRYKGALAGSRARTVWVGDVLIRADATGTDSYELNRNLLLSKGARADSIPNLEILTGQVERAGHASATGHFDEEALFYLCSRGIPPVEARRLVVRAFFAEIISSIAVPEVAERVSAVVEAELAGALE